MRSWFEEALEAVVQASAEYFVMQDRGDLDGEKEALRRLEDAKAELRKSLGFTREDAQALDSIGERIKALLPKEVP